MKLAKTADRKRERAARLTSRALAAKAEADAAAAEYRTAARKLLEED